MLQATAEKDHFLFGPIPFSSVPEPEGMAILSQLQTLHTCGLHVGHISMILVSNQVETLQSSSVYPG